MEKKDYHKLKEIHKENIINIYFDDAKKELIKSLELDINKRKKTNNNNQQQIITDIKLFIKELQNLNSNIITFIDKKNANQIAYTSFINNEAQKIFLYSDKLKYTSIEGIKITLIHELRHFIGLDQYIQNTKIMGKMDFSRVNFIGISDTNLLYKRRELITKITTFRHIMNKHNIKFDVKGIRKLFKLRNSKKLSTNERREIKTVYDVFYLFEKDLLIYLKLLVEKDKLKQNIKQT